jgi:hypothetical protein
VDLPPGIATVSVQAVGKGYAGLDAVVLAREVRWQPPESRSLPEPVTAPGSKAPGPN